MGKPIISENINCEKYREDLFETRVDLKAWKQSIKILSTSVTILIAILAFFGYNKIDTIESTIMNKANARLAKTDSILSEIDEKRIDDLNNKLSEKQREYEITLKNFEDLLVKNKELEDRLLLSLSPNQQIEHKISTYFIEPANSYFEIRQGPTRFKRGDNVDIYLSFQNNFDLSRANYLRLQLLENKENGRLLLDYFYLVEQRLNKLCFNIDVPQGFYVLNVGFISTKNTKNTYFRTIRMIEVR